MHRSLRDALGCSAGLAAMALAASALITAGLVVAWHSLPAPHPSVPAPDGYGVCGIDVSRYQGRIRWPEVKESGQVDFVYMKATEGRSYVDRRFARNWDGARAQGLPTGAYHYFSLCRTGAEQAAHFIDTVPRQTDSLPHVVDVEPDERCNRGDRWRTAEREVAVWLEAVEAHYGVAPIVYASDWVHRERLAGLSADRWVASYTHPPRQPWVFWQYTDAGSVRGISGPVDQNVYVGTVPPWIEPVQASR